MSLRADGTYRCDRDGVDVGNGGIVSAVVISRLDPVTGGATVLHLCLDREEAGKTVKGCASRVLTAKALADYLITRGEQ